MWRSTYRIAPGHIYRRSTSTPTSRSTPPWTTSTRSKPTVGNRQWHGYIWWSAHRHGLGQHVHERAHDWASGQVPTDWQRHGRRWKLQDWSGQWAGWPELPRILIGSEWHDLERCRDPGRPVEQSGWNERPEAHGRVLEDLRGQRQRSRTKVTGPLRLVQH